MGVIILPYEGGITLPKGIIGRNPEIALPNADIITIEKHIIKPENRIAIPTELASLPNKQVELSATWGIDERLRQDNLTRDNQQATTTVKDMLTDYFSRRAWVNEESYEVRQPLGFYIRNPHLIGAELPFKR